MNGGSAVSGNDYTSLYNIVAALRIQSSNEHYDEVTNQAVLVSHGRKRAATYFWD